MPAATRSANKQTKLEAAGAGTATRPTSKSFNSLPKKRKTTRESDDVERGKKTKKTAVESRDKLGDEIESGNNSITINRAPVLELWAGCVTHFLYPALSWKTCLSAGGAISTITAISKGRSIGKIDKPDLREAEPRKQERRKKAKEENLEELEVMSFRMSLDKDGQALVGGKPRRANEETLKKKFGDAQYQKVRQTFENALQTWKGKEEELQHDAFQMYENFRPIIPAGQSGWGRKGQLNLETVKNAISNGP